MSSDEKSKILKMLEEGKITAEEAAKLIEVLDEIDLLTVDDDEESLRIGLDSIKHIGTEIDGIAHGLSGLKELKKLKGLGAIIGHLGLGTEPTATETIEWIPEQELKSLRIKCGNGKVRLTAGDTTKIRITKKVFCSEDKADQNLAKIKVETKEKDGKAEISVGTKRGTMVRSAIEIEGTLSANCALELDISNGKVETGGINVLKADISNGKIISDAAYLDIDMSNGKIIAQYPETLKFDCSNGKAVIENAERLKNMDVDFSNGKIYVIGKRLPEGVDYEIEMSNGKAIFELGEKPDNIEIEYEKNNGKVSGDLEFTKESRNCYVYKSGEPNGSIEVDINNGKLEFIIDEDFEYTDNAEETEEELLPTAETVEEETLPTVETVEAIPTDEVEEPEVNGKLMEE